MKGFKKRPFKGSHPLPGTSLRVTPTYYLYLFGTLRVVHKNGLELISKHKVSLLFQNLIKLGEFAHLWVNEHLRYQILCCKLYESFSCKDYSSTFIFDRPHFKQFIFCVDIVVVQLEGGQCGVNIFLMVSQRSVLSYYLLFF